MKSIIYTLILTFSVLVSEFAFAGGTGGGGVMMRESITNPANLLENATAGGVFKSKEIIFNMGQKNGVVKFAYGKLVNSNWQIQNIQISDSELAFDLKVVEALNQSLKMKNWAEIR